MPIIFVFFVLIFLSIGAFYIGYRRADFLLTSVPGGIFHSRPVWHGFYVFSYFFIPSFLCLIFLSLIRDPVIDFFLLSSVPDVISSVQTRARSDILLDRIRLFSSGISLSEPEPYIVSLTEQYRFLSLIFNYLIIYGVPLFGILFGYWSYCRISSQHPARILSERLLDKLMFCCACVAIVTTFGIIIILLLQSSRFFSSVSFWEFLFGLNWEPQIPIREGQIAATGAFGAIPVFSGTLLIAFLAMLVAVPIGIPSGIYLSEYASPRVRSILKPILEILAGIPTIVYGFFAILVVAPTLRGASDGIIDLSPNSALVAGLVMGIMIIPFISSFCDDALSAVPSSMREGSYGLGATQGETILRILVPAAFPGIMGGVLLALSRAIGETMIVVMAAGLIANLTFNPLESVTTVTVQIVSLLTGDTEFDNPKTLSAFALGLVLFLVTLCLNIIALTIVQRYRERYE